MALTTKLLSSCAALLCGTALVSPAAAQTAQQMQQQIEQLKQQMQTQLQQIQAQQQQIQQLQDRLGGMSTAVEEQHNDLSAIKTAQQQAPLAPGDGWKVGLINGHPG